MRLTAVEISNFRQFESLHLQFPRNSPCDLHIIVAENGVGKTNILNAVTWCLYEQEPHLGDTDKNKGLPRFNLNAKARAEAGGREEFTISVKVHAEDNGTSIVFSRQAGVRVSSGFEKRSEFLVLVNDGTGEKILPGEEAAAYVEQYMPQKIRQYFYFDGEQLDSYFTSSDSARIRDTIHGISQVDVVSLMKDRLGKVSADYKGEAGKKAPDIKEINEKIAEVTGRIDTLNSDIQTILEQVAASEAIIQKNSEYLKGQENVPGLEEKFEELQAKKDRLEQTEAERLREFYRFVREAKTALSLYPSAKAVLELIEEKERNHLLPPNIDRKLLQDLLDGHASQCVVCQGALTEEAKRHIQALIDQMQVSSETSNLLMRIKSELERITETARGSMARKAAVLRDLKSARAELDQCRQALQDTDAELRRFSDKESIIKLHTERMAHQELRKTNLEKLAIYRYQRTEAEAELQSLEANLRRALSQAEECRQLNSRIEFLERAAAVVAEIEAEMMREVRIKMELRTMDYFQALVWKQGVFDHIVLDENYHLDLIHRDGYPCIGSCSAAERSLLALAFTLALHEVSGFSSLLFIDTPLARVSGKNRTNFTTVLKKVSEGKQLILAFTPDEYSDSVQAMFQPAASTLTWLRMNSGDATEVVENTPV